MASGLLEEASLENRCNDCGEPADPKYTMDYTDVHPGPDGFIYWCSFCGPRNHALEKAIQKALATKGPEWVKKFEAAIVKAEKERN